MEDRKKQRKIVRRKEKVERMIQEQQDKLNELDFGHEDYRRIRAKLSRLKQELRSLEAGYLPGAW